jgi:hypothetical protein
LVFVAFGQICANRWKEPSIRQPIIGGTGCKIGESAGECFDA